MTTKDLVDAARGIVALADECSRLRSENEELHRQLQNYVQAHANVCEDLARAEAQYAELARAWQEAVEERDSLRREVDVGNRFKHSEVIP